MRKVVENEVILKEEEVNRVLYKIVSGSVAMYINYGQDREYLVGVISAGKCFGETGFLVGAPSPYTIVANGDMELEEIYQDDFQRFIIENPQSAIEIMTGMAASVNLLEAHIDLLLDEADDKVSKKKELTMQLENLLRLYRTYDFSGGGRKHS